MSTRVRELLDEFTARLEAVLRDDLRDAIERIGLGIGERRSLPASRAPRVIRGKGAKRDSAALEALSDKFTNFVAKNPGLRIEEINKELGTTTKDLALPIRKLVAEGALKTHGKKRATTYSVGRSKSAKKPARRS
jgi:predicted transcriptional regulator